MNNIEKDTRKLFDKLSEYQSIDLVSECLKIARDEGVSFEDNELLPMTIVIENYLDKFKIQDDIIAEEKVIGYSALIENRYTYK